MEKLEEFFKLKERGTSVKIEVLAGITTFMTMAYVLVVQPGAIIGFGDAVSFTDINGLVITKEAIAVTCAVISALITLLMGFYANLPFALATGMGTNFMFGALLQSNTLSFGAIMAITLISGLIFVVLTIFGVRDLIVKAIPKNIKVAIGSAIGFYIAYLGFKNSGIGTFTNGIGMGNFKEPAVFIALLGLVIIAVLTAYRVNGAILIGIVAVTVMGIPLGVTTLPDTFAKIPDVSSWGNIVFCFDFKGLLSFQAIVYVFIAFCGDFFSTLGTVLGVAGKAGMLDEDGNKVLKKGKPVADPKKRDTENVPLDEDMDVYFVREVLPYNPDAWIDKSKTKVGYEIPFTRTFYEYKEIEPADQIAQRIEEHEHALMQKLHDLFGKDGE